VRYFKRHPDAWGIDMRFIHYDGLRERGIRYSRAHLWRMEKHGKFPRLVKLGGHTIGWVESEIDQHILDRIAERDAASEREDAE
jgi:prophage regulatory protein